jgi:hypothetical protein
MDDADLTPPSVRRSSGCTDVLADPAVWAEPPPYLQEAVVAGIAEEAGAGRRRRFRLAVAGIAAAVMLAVGIGVGLYLDREQPVEFAASLSGTELSPDASGDVTLTKTPAAGTSASTPPASRAARTASSTRRGSRTTPACSSPSAPSTTAATSPCGRVSAPLTSRR